MPDMYFDFGNADAKFFDGSKGYGYFRHALAELTESQWHNVVNRAKHPPEGYIAVDGHYFAIGDKARRYTIKDKPKGAGRYAPEYYGVAMCYALSQLFTDNTKTVNLYASHAPRDIQYSEDIVKATIGRWKFVTHNGIYNLTVKNVETYDEPLGGFNHAILTKDGKVLKSNPYSDKTALVVDVGGYTCDVIAVDPGGMIDESSLHSTLTGAIDTYSFFERELRSRYRDAFRDVGDIDAPRLEDAMQKGYYQFGNTQLECNDIAHEAINRLVNDIRDVIRSAGGIANYDVILLTGGGSALVYETLNNAERMIDFIMVEDERELMRFANVFGGAKLFTMLKRLGVL